MSQSIRQRNELSGYGRVGKASPRRMLTIDAVPDNQATTDSAVRNILTNQGESNDRTPKDTDCVRGIVFALAIVLPVYAVVGVWLFL